MTTIEEFRAGAAAGEPPAEFPPALRALWWLARDDWKSAHEVVQAHEGEGDCDRVHAHLHRQEGDLANAGYWYRRARREAATGPLAEEWAQLAAEFLAKR
ncbi:MAG: hypothetical protein KIT25_09630 [Enhydrobacter sp.]|nr:MAG: hypothetical protein KIT25_09630 [Enhydrobacter sp.]